MPFQIRKHHCVGGSSISKKTVMASFEEGTKTRTWLEELGEDWTILSFFPESRTVCIKVTVLGGSNHISLRLPPPTGKS